MDIDARGSDVAEIPLGIVLEIIGHGYPQRLLAALQIVLVDDAGDCATLAHTSAISDQETSPTSVRKQVIVRLGGVRNGLQLQGTKMSAVYRLVGQGQLVVDIAGLHGAQRGCLHHGIWMLLAQFHCGMGKTAC